MRKKKIQSTAFASKLIFDEALFNANVRWAEKLAGIYFRKHIAIVPGTRTTLVELKQTALIGLWQAVQRYIKGGVDFKTYAALRIKGNIVDEVRNSGYFGSIRREHVAPHILQLDANSIKFAYYNGKYDFEDTEEAEKILKLGPRKYRRVLRLYFIKGLTQSETAKEIGRSESRINQIIKLALNQIRRKMGAQEQ